jgi:hypothetical protein
MKCATCRRPLTNSISVKFGFGPDCLLNGWYQDHMEHSGMKLTAKELSDLLNGAEYGNDYSSRIRELSHFAFDSGLVIASGESDDLLEFYGAFRDEAGAWEGTTELIDSEGPLPSWESASEDEEEAAKYFARKPNARSIEAVWCEEGSGYSWILKTDIPHEIFSVMEDGEGFSRGIVFSIEDLKAWKQ